MKENELKIDDLQGYEDFLSKDERKMFEQFVRPIKGKVLTIKKK